MGWYGDHVFPRILDRVMDRDDFRRVRAEVCAPLSGEVLEIGFGTGLNLPHLPGAVERLLAVDPMERGRTLAAGRVAAAAAQVDFVGLDGQHLPLPDDSVDAVLSTWTLCSVLDPVAADAEIARVLRPGGALHFVEHGLAPEPAVRRWQQRCNPIQRRVACGCMLTHDMPRVLEQGGLRIDRVSQYYAPHAPRVMGWTTQGVATPA